MPRSAKELLELLRLELWCSDALLLVVSFERSAGHVTHLFAHSIVAEVRVVLKLLLPLLLHEPILHLSLVEEGLGVLLLELLLEVGLLGRR